MIDARHVAREMRSVSVIIATHNRAASLRRTLTSLAAQQDVPGTWEVIVADNADDPETALVVDGFQGRVAVRRVVEIIPGQNAARNRALQGSLGELVVFTDDDTRADEYWLSNLLHTADEHPEADFFGGKIIPVWPTAEKPWQADAWFASFAFADQDLGERVRSYAPCFPSSPNMAIRRSVFDAGVRFNDAIGPIGSRRISGSETELFARLAAAGHHGVYNPKAVIYHHISERMLESTYLRKRCFAMGMGMAIWHAEPELPQWFGISRYRIGEVFRSHLRKFSAWAKGDEKAAIESDCRAALHSGYCYAKWSGLARSYSSDTHSTRPFAEAT